MQLQLIYKLFDLLRLTFRIKRHIPGRPILDPAHKAEVNGKTLGRLTEPDTLHPTGKYDILRDFWNRMSRAIGHKTSWTQAL